MRRANKSANLSSVEFSDFSGGLNLLAAPENIGETELSECRNMTFSTQPGKLRTRKGTGLPLKTFDAVVDGLYWFDGKLLAVAAQHLWSWDGSTWADRGALTGTGRPFFKEYGGDLYIATGAKINKWTGAALSTIADSHDTTAGLFTKDGRLCCWLAASDNYYGAASGDPTTWSVPQVDPQAADPVEIQAGYKIEGNVVAVIPFLTDLVIFKENLIMRMTGTMSSVQGIVEVARKESLANQFSAVNVGGKLFYLDGSTGLRMIEGVDSYGDMIPADIMPKVNQWIRSWLGADCRLWHLKHRKIIVVGIGGDTVIPCYYDYGIDAMPALMWAFDDNVRDFCEPDRDTLYVAVGSCVYSLSEGKDVDPDDHTKTVNVDWGFTSRKMRSATEYLVKRISISLNALSDNPDQTPIKIMISGSEVMSVAFGAAGSPPVYGNTDAVYGNTDPCCAYLTLATDFTQHNNLRAETVEVQFDGNGGPAVQLTRFTVEYSRVGVIG